MSPIVAPTTAPKDPSGSAPALRARSASSTSPATVRAARGAGVLDLRALGVGGEREDEHAGAVLLRGVEQRVEGADAEERARGDRVDGHRRRRVEVGVGVGLGGGPDVAALDVEDDERAEVAGGDDGPLEHGDAARPVPLEEGRLRLHRGDRPGERLDRGHREPLQPGDVVGQAPGVQERGVRVDAGAERPALVLGGVQPGSEGCGPGRPEVVCRVVPSWGRRPGPRCIRAGHVGPPYTKPV